MLLSKAIYEAEKEETVSRSWERLRRKIDGVEEQFRGNISNNVLFQCITIYLLWIFFIVYDYFIFEVKTLVEMDTINLTLL